MPSEINALPVEPLYDTWGTKKDAGAWCITADNPVRVAEAGATNAWYSMIMTHTINAFSDLIRVVHVGLSTIHRDDTKGKSLEWQIDEDCEDFMRRVEVEIKNYPAPIYSMELEVDVFVYCRTTESPNQPVRAWVNIPNEFIIWGGPENDTAYLCFEIAHTLFCPSSVYGDDNKELYELNCPLLEKALRTWEERLGKIQDVEGLMGIYEYGYLPDES